MPADIMEAEAPRGSSEIEKRIAEIYGGLLGSGKPVRSPEVIAEKLRREYRLLVDVDMVRIVVAAFMNGRPVMFEGPPGTGKTEIGEAILTLWAGKQAFLLPCSENYDEYRVIGDFHPLMAMKHGFNEASFIPRTLLAALVLGAGVLVDEIRRSSEEFQNMLLDIIDKRRIVVPELKRVFRSNDIGFQMIFTSNPEDIAQNELSDAFLRRVVRIRFDYPDPRREAEIVRLRLNSKAQLPPSLLASMIEAVGRLRKRTVHKPGPADTVEWAQLAARVAELRGSGKVEPRDVLEAGRAVLIKRDEDADDVEEILEEFFGEK